VDKGLIGLPLFVCILMQKAPLLLSRLNQRYL
jgi:hypothetical protein